ncbi:uncharacterized protein JN550_012473 [Neoarthrinium moseri]|uniref:uncharacterized protein n=1 Tax=Neoarthrinium moseri TaxID=1658444 RepID=UPI001FDBA92C|nr:uncharacterized protein JN550_012473 [Neoarthrinium moseri]KAI1858723.1 hypothetical protein JN550_012473 [Neoarthrinium moseri]
MADHAHEQAGLEVGKMGHPAHDQAGLEVVPEPEAPQVIEGPTIQKPWDQSHSAGPPYQQYDPSAQGGYAQGQYGHYPPHSGYPDSAAHAPHSQWEPSHVGTLGPSASEKGVEPTIFGIKRRKFWLIFGPLIAVLVIGLAVGLGVGLGASHHSSSSASSKKFLVLCDLDYNSGEGSTDIGNVETDTVEDCANTCAANGSCVGAGWGDYYGKKYCWMKSSLGKSHFAGNWYFLVKQ